MLNKNQNLKEKTAKTNVLGEFFHSKKLIKQDEQLDDLERNGLMLIQNKNGYKFSTDSVLLSDFATIKKSGTFVELCSGSGVVSILFNSKNNAKKGFMIELDPSASEMSKRTLSYNNITNIEAVNVCIKDCVKLIGHEIADTVMVNPPYFDSGMISKNEAISVARHQLTLSLDDISQTASKLLKYGGKFYMINPSSKLVEIFCSLKKYNLEPKKLRVVYPKKSKAPNVVLIEAVKGGGLGLQILPPLVLNNEDGTETEELKSIYNRN